jgi:hypothetical protein
VIAGAVARALLLAAGIGALLLWRRRRKSISDSDATPRDLEFVQSTLHATLVTFSDYVTIEGGPPRPNDIFSLSSAHSEHLSLI